MQMAAMYTVCMADRAVIRENNNLNSYAWSYATIFQKNDKFYWEVCLPVANWTQNVGNETANAQQDIHISIEKIAPRTEPGKWGGKQKGEEGKGKK